MKKNKITGNKKNKKSRAKIPLLTDRWRNTIIIGLIITITFILFSKAIRFQFVLWDDNSYITENSLIKDLSLEGIKNIFTTPVIGMYNPLAFLIYSIIFKFWGLNPGAFHFFNIIFHLIAIIVIYKFIFKLTLRYETATIVTLLFALHPMHVGVVTWVSELKTSLYLIFYFLALINYLEYIRNKYRYKYLIYTALLFILSAMSKPSAVTLAPMLFLLDYYISRNIDKRLFLEKIPFFIIAFFFGFLTIYTHSEFEDTIFDVNKSYSFINNLLVSNYSVAFYIEKLLLPIKLCTIYPYPENDVFLPLKYYLAIPVIPLILFLIHKAGIFKKELIFGLLFFVVAISVLLRIVPSGFFQTANRYTYLSYTGLFFIIGQYYTYLIDGKFSYSNKVKKFLLVLLFVMIVFYCYRTTVRIKVWENNITLFTDIIKKEPNLALAYNNRALAKKDMGDYRGAIADLDMAVKNDPEYVWAYCNRGLAKKETGDDTGAMADFNKSLSLDSNFVWAYYNRGLLKNKVKDYNGSIEDYSSAIRLNKEFFEAYFNRGMTLCLQEKYSEAVSDFTKAIAIRPESSDAYFNRGMAKIISGQKESGCQDFKKAGDLGLTEAYNVMNQNCN